MYQPKTIYAQIAMDSIESYIKQKETQINYSNLPNDLEKSRACFVTIRNFDGELRGCMGTISPVEKNLLEEIKRNAIAACSRDYRFNLVNIDELEEITVEVSVLTEPIIINNIDELDQKKYGVIVSDGKFRKGVLLPDIPAIKSVEEQLDIAMKKGGMEGMSYSEIDIYKFETLKYE
jgi:AmmeMemoRadiSam system protein A